MKILRLSAIELANASVLPIQNRQEYLFGIETPKVFWGYPPLVAALPKLLLAESGLFGHLPPGDEENTLNQIRHSCKSGVAQQNACVAAAEAIIGWRKQTGAYGRIVSPEPLRMSVDTLRYCSDVAVIHDERAYVLSLDPRSSMTLSRGGKEFIKSLIHHTALIGDLRDAQAALLRTPKAAASGKRVAVFEPLVGEPAFSLEELMKRVSETYSIWETILRGRTSGAAREA